MKKLNKKGFTLIEMLVVIAIIAILVAIIVPTVTKANGKAAAATNAANLRTYTAELAVLELNGDIQFDTSTNTYSVVTGRTVTMPTVPTMKAVAGESYSATITLSKTAAGELTASATATGEGGATRTIENFATYAEKGSWS